MSIHQQEIDGQQITIPNIRIVQNARSPDRNMKNKPSLLNSKCLSPSKHINQRWTKSKSKSKKPSALFSNARVIVEKQSYIKRQKSENIFLQPQNSEDKRQVARYKSLMVSDQVQIKIDSPGEKDGLSFLIDQFGQLDLSRIPISNIHKTSSRQAGQKFIDGDQQLINFIK